MKNEVEKIYGNRVRVRVCGICLQNEKILLIHHAGVGEKGNLWAPPGGGLDFGESTEETLIREYREETGLTIQVQDFLFAHEFIAPPLHAIELYFKVKIKEGIITKGKDPEMSDHKQIIQDIRYWSFEEIKQMDPFTFHQILRKVNTPHELLEIRGFYRS